MAMFPLSMFDISLWIAITAIILLATSEFLFSYSGNLNFPLDKNRLRLAALILGAAFLVMVLMRAM
jgi:hypothetical protein